MTQRHQDIKDRRTDRVKNVDNATQNRARISSDEFRKAKLEQIKRQLNHLIGQVEDLQKAS